MKDKKVANWLVRQRVRGLRRAREVRHGSRAQQGRDDRPAAVRRWTSSSSGRSDAASAMTYNELAQVLETKNPKTGKLYTLNDLNVIKMQNVGTSMLEDGIFTTADYLKSPANHDDGEEVPRGVAPGLDLLPRPPERLRRTSCSRTGRRCRSGHQTWHDERDQRADLAGAEGHRDHGPGGVRALGARSSRRTAS